MSENEKMEELYNISQEIVRTLLKDGYEGNQQALRQAVELLSRSVGDLSFMYGKKDACHEDLLKGTVAKVQISYNAVQMK
ncbi:hypothetical protein CEF21_09960 [Bacillus sp. FJAT-42376]|uniref:hypothetical protein n=1 Tax=Bacillus sp. FJAT-42376 TaxID=2014076 RepID=UPI000F4E6BAD|nr:hypothetical protein [Bacillus sp. FJAT-42376]AZB42585.1 hypothetical protein CEF21_09960 [Bacillus sp. FJAT-42376]